MLYSKATIKRLIGEGKIAIEPFDESSLKGASYILHLDKKLTTEELLFASGEWKVVETEEIVSLGENVCATLFTHGHMAQQGFDALMTDCFVEPGFKGKLKLSIVNHSPDTLQLDAGEKVVKIVFSSIT